MPVLKAKGASAPLASMCQVSQAGPWAKTGRDCAGSSSEPGRTQGAAVAEDAVAGSKLQQAGLHRPEDHPRGRRLAGREAQGDARSREAGREPRGAGARDQIDRRGVERFGESGRRTHRPAEATIEVAGTVVVEGERGIHQQALGMNEPILDRQGEEERLERRARGTEAGGVVEGVMFPGAGVEARGIDQDLSLAMVDDHRRGGESRRALGEVTEEQPFRPPLQLAVEAASDAIAGAGDALGEARRLAREAPANRGNRLGQGPLDFFR